MYYIKKLGHNEMGSPGIDGKPKRGRFILLSKDSGDFFPYLSKVVLNDTLVLPIVMQHKQVRMYAKFDYHNSKHATDNPDEDRDEYRLYLNNDIDRNKELFRPEDIVVIEKLSTKYFTDENNVIPYIYSISLFRKGDAYYSFLEDKINRSKLKRCHSAIFTEDLDFVYRPDVNAIEKAEISKDVIKVVEKEQKELVESIEDSDNHESIENIRGANLFNSVSFRDFVMMAYGYKCAITGKSISYESLINLEAAHIQPKAHAGTFLPCNGLALSRDMHWAFDKGFFTISDDYKIIVHEKVKSTLLAEYDGAYINIPKDEYFRPEKKFLKHHRENVFGLFINSGSIRAI